MASYLPSSIQKRLLRYALLQSGLLDESSLDLESLDITFGRQNVINLRDVSLDVRKLADILQLPAELLISGATVALLRLTVPADLYHGAIVVEAGGIYAECQADFGTKQKGRSVQDRTDDTAGPRTSRDNDDHRDASASIRYLASSFLHDQTPDDTRRLESLYHSQRGSTRYQPEVPQGSEDLGTGTALSLPGFLATFIQGIIDRARIEISDTNISLTVNLPCAQVDARVNECRGTFLLRVKTCSIAATDVPTAEDKNAQNTDKLTHRNISIDNVVLYENISSRERDTGPESRPVSRSDSTASHASTETARNSNSNLAQSIFLDNDRLSPTSSGQLIPDIAQNDEQDSDSLYDAGSSTMQASSLYHSTYSAMASNLDDQDPMEHQDTGVRSTIFGQALPSDCAIPFPESSQQDSLADRLNEYSPRADTSQQASDILLESATHNVSSMQRMPGQWYDSSAIAVTESLAENSEAKSESQIPMEAATQVDTEVHAPDKAQAIQDLVSISSQLVHVDHISITIPTLQAQDIDGIPDSVPSKNNIDVPGAFSVYADSSASIHYDSPHLQQSYLSPAPPMSKFTSRPTLDAVIGSVHATLHPAVLKFCLQTQAMWSPTSSRTQRFAIVNVPVSEQRRSSTYWRLALSEVKVSVPFADRFGATTDAQELARLQFMRIDCRHKVQEGLSSQSITVGQAEASLAGHRVLHFADATNGGLSLEQISIPSIACTMSGFAGGLHGRHARQVALETSCLMLDVNLPVLADSLQSFGGLSGILSVGTTVFSAGAIETSPRPSPGKKGVRFEPESTSFDCGPELKINIRIAKTLLALQGTAGNVQASTSAVKVVVRERYIACVVGSLLVHGPHTVSNSTLLSDPTITLEGLRLEYLTRPRDEDLERLILLLSPTECKYERDDDILLDTLMRQRRQGSVLCVNAAALKAQTSSWDILQTTKALLAELGEFSAVANYLPEDDRPGLLTLLGVKSITAQPPQLHRIGEVTVNCSGLNVAHVGMPSMLAIAVDSISINQGQQALIVQDLVPAPVEKTPVLLCKLIGDELEPTLQLRLFDISLTYDAATVAGAISRDDQTHDNAADLVASQLSQLMHSVTGIAESVHDLRDTSPDKRRKLGVELLLLDCAIVLQPIDTSARGMFVAENVLATTNALMASANDQITIKTNIRQAALYVSDGSNQQASDSQYRHGLHTRDIRLAELGFVHVARLTGTNVCIRLDGHANSNSPELAADVGRGHIALACCADSFQTLTQVLNGLTPPAPPSAEAKFRIEPQNLNDMISSLSGNAFVDSASPPTTLFDADEIDMTDDTHADTYDDDDEHEFDDFDGHGMTASIYENFEALAEHDTATTHTTSSEIAASLLEDDPFEMPLTPTATRMTSEQLLRHLKKQNITASHGPRVQLPVPPILRDTLDESIVLGTAYRWTTNRSKDECTMDKINHKLPFMLHLHDVDFSCKLYDGYDWQRTRDAISDAVQVVEGKAKRRSVGRRESGGPHEGDDDTVLGDCLFNSIYIGIPAGRNAADLRRHINKEIDDLASETESHATSGANRQASHSDGLTSRPVSRQHRLKLQRSKTHKIAIELKGLSVNVKVLPRGVEDTQNVIEVAVRQVEVFDNVPTSTWRKFLTSYEVDGEEREMGKPMVYIEMRNVRTIKDLAATEVLIKVTVLPLRLHVDQDALDFTTRFFAFQDTNAASPTAPKEEAFIQRIEVNTVHMYLDYKPKRVDYGGLRSGRYTEFKNFFILDKAHIILRHAIVYGIRGFDALHDTLNDVWMPDIKHNQLPGVLGGLAPVSSLVSIGSGLVDVVAIPIQEYKKDGRLMRSIQKGTSLLMRNTTSEIARLGAKVAIGTQTVLSGAETMFSSGDALHSRRRMSLDDEEYAVSNYADQPLSVLQGLVSARKHLERDLLTARDALIAVQGEVMDSQSASSAAQAVARHTPTIILRPVIGASRAVGQTLLGVGNQVDKTNARKLDDKYKRH